jgi:lipoprotein-anchoring transpeptidase ErfK/SrfK
MRRLLLAAFGAVLSSALLLQTARAQSGITVEISRASQTMRVTVDGIERYHWPVSTGRRGYGTPAGVFHPQLMAAHWYSRVYYHAPMPHAIFFHGGYAIHGSYEISRLGGPASHGCVRLHPAAAAILFALVQRDGMGHTIIVVH